MGFGTLPPLVFASAASLFVEDRVWEACGNAEVRSDFLFCWKNGGVSDLTLALSFFVAFFAGVAFKAALVAFFFAGVAAFFTVLAAVFFFASAAFAFAVFFSAFFSAFFSCFFFSFLSVLMTSSRLQR